jgi:transposase
MGSKDCRTLLYEAAQVLLTREGTPSKLKAWGLKLMQKKGRKKAIVAVARKLAVIMHRMLMDKTEFRYT